MYNIIVVCECDALALRIWVATAVPMMKMDGRMDGM